MRKLSELAAGLAVSYAALRGADQNQAMAGLVSLAQTGLALKDFDEKVRRKARSIGARTALKWVKEQQERRKRQPGGAA